MSDNVSLEDLFDEVEAKVEDPKVEINHNVVNQKGLSSGFEELESDVEIKEPNETNKEEENDLPVVEEPAEPVKQEEVKVEKTPSIEDIKKMLDEENRKREEERLAKEKAEQEKIEQEKIAKEQQQQLESEINFDGNSVLSEDDKKLINEVAENYPEIKKVIDSYEKKNQAVTDKRIELAVRNAVLHVFNEVQKYVGPIIQEHYQQKEKQATNKFKEVHSDFDENMSKDLQSWINSYPANIRKGFETAFNNGSIEDKIEVVNMYKQTKGINKAVQVQTEPVKTTANKKIEEKKNALSPVSSKTTASKASEKEDENIDKSKLFDEI